MKATVLVWDHYDGPLYIPNSTLCIITARLDEEETGASVCTTEGVEDKQGPEHSRKEDAEPAAKLTAITKSRAIKEKDGLYIRAQTTSTEKWGPGIGYILDGPIEIGPAGEVERPLRYIALSLTEEKEEKGGREEEKGGKEVSEEEKEEKKVKEEEKRERKERLEDS